MNYPRINNAVGWLCAAVATITYLLTLEPTTSWWDPGEFIAAANRMQVVHQPGAPLFLMLQNLFGNVALGNGRDVAFWMNAGSAVFSGLTVMFLCWTITAMARKLIGNAEKELRVIEIVQVIGAGVVGALAYAFSDTFWFSAVESEVYALSSLCTAIVFWAILKWDVRADQPGADRWLVFIAYMMGLSIGVHLLNLLTIPVLALVIYFRRARHVTFSGGIQAMLIGCAALAFILWGVVQYLVKAAAYADLFAVNTLGLAFGSGVAAFMLLVVGGLVYGIRYSIRRGRMMLNTALLCLGFVLFGYTSFVTVLIRAKANPSLNNSQPDDAFSFLWYLNRGQFGSEPLLNGPYFDANLADIQQGPTAYRKGNQRYEPAGTDDQPVYDRTTVLPRIYSKRDNHPVAYRMWLGLDQHTQPGFGDNLRFLADYQVWHMYWRYFLWNFAGRQNDLESKFDNSTEGNWISGIHPIDQWRLGGQNTLPQSAKEDPSRNTYYFIPLLLGLIGLFWQYRRNRRDAAVVALLFFFTGLAVVLYLNQSPLQVRERDYAYAGSFYAFAVWIGLGAIGLSGLLQKLICTRTAIPISLAMAAVVPILLVIQNWDDHDRSDRYMARDMALNYLESCAPDAILFTIADNDTFPLWYLQEVEGVRRDVRIVNLSLLGMDWAVRQSKLPVNGAAALPLSMEDRQFAKGTRDYLHYHDYGIKDSIELAKLLAILLSDNPQDQQQYADGTRQNFLPSKQFKLTVNREEVVEAGVVVPTGWHDRIVDTMSWTYPQNAVTRAELVIMDVLVNNHWKRPVYFSSLVPETHRLGLEDYLVSEGYALRLMPVLARRDKNEARLVHTDAVYASVMNRYAWGNMRHAGYLDPTSRGMVGQTLTILSDTAEMLLAEGKFEAASGVVNRAVDVLPDRIMQPDIAALYPRLADQLYTLGETEKANDVVERNRKFLDEQLAYYAAIGSTKSLAYPEQSGIRDSLYALQQFVHTLGKHGQLEQQEQTLAVLKTYQSLYL